MVTDSVTSNAFIASAPKDFGRKKRANRSAKLKQCKLDARREQWLAQVKNKGCKEEPTALHAALPPCKEKRKSELENFETTGRGVIGEQENETGSGRRDFDLDSPPNSVNGGSHSVTNFTASSSSGSSSCCSGCITEGEEEENDSCLDDWEAIADSLVANGDQREEIQNLGLELKPCPDSDPIVSSNTNSDNLDSVRENGFQEHARNIPPRLVPANTRAWRPDDAFRPQSLPDLSKQRSFPSTARNYVEGAFPWACSTAVNVPSFCPICCEDFDITDKLFMPCSCGFRVCLFCHKIILDGDGRCPGCRKPYEHDTVEAEASVHGGSLTVRLARSLSMMERS